ncbi:MAG: hypothetical protein JWM55_600 [Acidimicrobiaceae bacterium]|nr:hypothetical protein [Acidimicrobiaceae bacterium]
MPHRLMGNGDFLVAQQARLREPHVAPLTAFVEGLRTDDRWLPFIAPMHGGVEGRMLSLLLDPGRGTLNEGGSGMLSIENADQTAETQALLAEGAGVLASDFVPWNAYPWFIGRVPKKAEISEGTASLLALVDLLSKLEVVLLQGGEAQLAWRMALDASPDLRRRRLLVIETYHPSVNALQTPDPAERARRIAHRISAWKEAGEILATERIKEEP